MGKNTKNKRQKLSTIKSEKIKCNMAGIIIKSLLGIQIIKHFINVEFCNDLGNAKNR